LHRGSKGEGKGEMLRDAEEIR